MYNKPQQEKKVNPKGKYFFFFFLEYSKNFYFPFQVYIILSKCKLSIPQARLCEQNSLDFIIRMNVVFFHSRQYFIGCRFRDSRFKKGEKAACQTEKPLAVNFFFQSRLFTTARYNLHDPNSSFQFQTEKTTCCYCHLSKFGILRLNIPELFCFSLLSQLVCVLLFFFCLTSDICTGFTLPAFNGIVFSYFLF